MFVPENDGGTNSVRLTNLLAYSMYTFRVYAVNAIGSGTPSEEVQASEKTSKAREYLSIREFGNVLNLWQRPDLITIILWPHHLRDGLVVGSRTSPHWGQFPTG